MYIGAGGFSDRMLGTNMSSIRSEIPRVNAEYECRGRNDLTNVLFIVM
ncbi:MAG: hypothetical protein NVS2B7_29980 [Herpetosiphon sp.]